jgi:hypothetical protein
MLSWIYTNKNIFKQKFCMERAKIYILQYNIKQNTIHVMYVRLTLVVCLIIRSKLGEVCSLFFLVHTLPTNSEGFTALYSSNSSSVNCLAISIGCNCKHKTAQVGFEVLTTVRMKMAVFWVVAPCSLVEVCQHFKGPCCLHHQGNFPGPLKRW